MRGAVAILLILLAAHAVAQSDSAVATISLGREVYSQTCMACHGGDGKGTMPGVRDLTGEETSLAKTDDVLIRSITEGLTLSDTPIPMPPKGGNPSLSDAEIRAVLAYMRNEFSN